MARPARTATVAVALAALLVTSGCTGLSLDPGDSSVPPTDDVEERFDDIENLQATQVSTFTSLNDTGNDTAGAAVPSNATASDAAADNDTTTRSRLRIDFTGTQRQYSRQLAPAESAGDRVVVNESVMLVYDASDNEATRIPRVDSYQTHDQAAYFSRIVDAARSDGKVVEPADDVSPLPVVPATSSESSVSSDDIDGYRVQYLGTKTVSDRTAHGFRMTAVSEAAMDVNQTMWLDAEFYYPLETNRTLDVGNRTMHTTMRLENVTFNEELPEGSFQADLPENATVNTTEMPASETYNSRTALAENVETSVPDPDVPVEYTFEEATHMAGNFSHVSLRYTGDDGRVVVSKMERAQNRNSSGMGSTGENVTVAGHDGRYLATASSKFVSWSCDDHSYSVVATTLDREGVLDVAASVSCE